MRVPIPAISIIVPTLNEAARIERLVLALRAQNYDGDLQILVCDGNSDDATSLCAQKAGATVLSCERGVSRQRNAGAQAATGELLIFMDADCAPTPDFARRVMKAYQRLPFAVACPWFVAHDGGVAARLAYFVFDVLFFGGQNWLRAGSGVCLITPRRVFERVGGFDEKLGIDFNDIDLCLRLWRQNRRILFTPYCELYHFEGSTQVRTTQAPEEAQLFHRRWRDTIRLDPYYNPNASRDRLNFV